MAGLANVPCAGGCMSGASGSTHVLLGIALQQSVAHMILHADDGADLMLGQLAPCSCVGLMRTVPSQLVSMEQPKEKAA